MLGGAPPRTLRRKPMPDHEPEAQPRHRLVPARERRRPLPSENSWRPGSITTSAMCACMTVRPRTNSPIR
jgi:hypothetical protein